MAVSIREPQVSQQIDQHGGAPYQPHIIAWISVLQTAVQIFDGGATELYPDAHGCILLGGVWHGGFERDTRVLMEARPEFPMHVLQISSMRDVYTQSIFALLCSMVR